MSTLDSDKIEIVISPLNPEAFSDQSFEARLEGIIDSGFPVEITIPLANKKTAICTLERSSIEDFMSVLQTMNLSLSQNSPNQFVPETLEQD